MDVIGVCEIGFFVGNCMYIYVLFDGMGIVFDDVVFYVLVFVVGVLEIKVVEVDIGVE